MSKANALDDTEKTILVGALTLAGFLVLDAFVKRTERRSIAEGRETKRQDSPAMRRLMALRQTRRRGDAA